MLIEFAVENFKSFAGEQTLSLAAAGLRDEHPDRVALVEGPQKLDVLTSAIIMGKNGSGKSSLVDAMRFARSLIISSASEGQQGRPIPVKPHLFDTKRSTAPCSFRILFSVNKNVYQYAFSLNDRRILKENLEVADKTPRFRKLFERIYDQESQGYIYTFGEALKGDKATWKDATRDNSLFLSTANQLNSEVLKEPFVWFMDYFQSVDATGMNFSTYTSERCSNEINKRSVMEFLRSLDIDVADILIDEEEISDTLSSAFNSDFLNKMMKMDSDFGKIRRVRFVHKGAGLVPAELELSEESTGTRALFGLAGPIFDSLANGYCLIVDEINTSLHPLVLHRLVELFSNPKINRRRAQLIFTSHDTSILRDSYFRRDQIWFVEKDIEGKSSLVPLSDYAPRKGEALDRGYMSGRYGGIPFIGPIEPLMDSHKIWEDAE